MHTLITQQSNKFSTPKKHCENVSFSTSFSTVRTNSPSLAVDNSDTEDGVNRTFSVMSIISISDIQNKSIKRKVTPKGKGLDFEYFKPRNENNLYFKIISHPEDVLALAEEVISEYQKNKLATTRDVLELFIHVSGYQEFSLELKAFSTNYIIQVANKIQNTRNKLADEGLYLFKSNSEWGKFATEQFFSFVKALILVANKYNIISSTSLFETILFFLKTIARSQKRSLVHTGTEIIAKLTSYIVAIWEFNLVNNTVNRTDFEYFKKYIQSCLLIIFRNCCISDPTLYRLREVCAEEMSIWLIIKPEIFFDTPCIKKICHLILDESKKVRLAALDTCIKIIKQDAIHQYVIKVIPKLVELITDRLTDVEIHVIAKAIDCYAALIHRYRDFIAEEERNFIIRFIYTKHLVIAKAAGKFFAKYVGTENVLNTLVIINNQFKDKTPIFVESLLDYVPELQDFENLLVKLTEANMNDEELDSLLSIICHSAKQICTGTSEILRSKQIKAKVSESKKIDIANIFIRNIKLLFEKFSSDPNKIVMLVELLKVFDYEDYISIESQEFLSALRTLCDLFLKTDDEKCLEVISEFFSILSVLNNRPVNSLLTKLKQYTITCAVTKLRELNEETASLDTFVSETEDYLIQTVAITKHHNILDIINWNIFYGYLSEMEEICSEKMTSYLMKCCVYYLVWALDNLKQNVVDEQDIEKLKQMFEEFSTFVFQKLRFGSINIKPPAYECICDLHILFMQKLTVEDIDPRLKSLVPIISDISKQNDMSGFILHNLFMESQLSLLQKRELLAKTISVVLMTCLNLNFLKYIFVHFYSHQEQFGVIMKDTLNILKSFGELFLQIVVMYSLTHIHQEFLAVELETTSNSDAARALRKLIQQFNIDLRRDEIKAIISMSFNYALNSEENYSFLSFIAYFMTKFNREEISKISYIFKEKFSEDIIKSNKYLLDFSLLLKEKPTRTKKMPKTVSKKKPLNIIRGSFQTSQETSTTSTVVYQESDESENFEIEDSEEEN